MSYELLRGLYYGESSNADLSTPETRARMHVESPLDSRLPQLIAAGQDVILTGNPGDGKSHLVAMLRDRSALASASVELDLSARPVSAVVTTWTQAITANRRFVMCANEGPLTSFIEEASKNPSLASRAAEMKHQLGRLAFTSGDAPPTAPDLVTVIDLADRNVLDVELVTAAIERVCSSAFLPNIGARAVDTTAGRNLLLFAETEAVRNRFARLVRHAGRKIGTHITFRQLWTCVAYGVCGAKSESKLRAELSRGEVRIGSFPLDYLCAKGGRGILIDAVRKYADPAKIATPTLDDEIWTRGAPRHGEWLVDEPEVEPPERMWANGDRSAALDTFASLKRLASLAHESGLHIVESIEAQMDAPGDYSDAELLTLTTRGLRNTYLNPDEERRAPAWLREGVPLWIGHTYRDVPISQRPHVAVDAIATAELCVRRPRRAPWIADSLGPLPEVAWLEHTPSGTRIRVDSELLARLRLASMSTGPLVVPERVGRYLSLLAGWLEGSQGGLFGEDKMAVLRAPRDSLAATATVQQLEPKGATYAKG